jgi:hypothetical protein
MLRALIEPIYQPDGILAGLVSLNDSGQLVLYRDLSFAQPQVLLTSVQSVTVERHGKRTPWTNLAGDLTSLLVRILDTDGAETLRTINYRGSVSPPLPNAYPSFAEGWFVTDQYVYYYDSAVGPSGLVYTYYRSAINGGAPPEAVFQYAIASNQSKFEMVATDGQTALLTGGVAAARKFLVSDGTPGNQRTI